MSKITERQARVLFQTGHPVRLVRADGARLTHWASCVTGWVRTFDEFRASGLRHWKVGDDPAHWEKPLPSRSTHDEAAGHIFRREPFEIGNISGTYAFAEPAPVEPWRYETRFFGDLPRRYIDEFHADNEGGIDYVVWSYKTVIAWTPMPGGVKMPPVRYSNTTTQHQWLVARALDVKFTTTESAREGKGKTPYTSRSGW